MNRGRSVPRISIAVYRYYRSVEANERDPPETTRLRRPPLTADAFRIGFQRKPAKPDDLRGRRNARQNPSYLSSFIDRVVDRNHSFVCNQRCSQMRCQSGVEETKSNVLYFSFFPFFPRLQSTIEQSRKRRRSNILFHLSYDNIPFIVNNNY